MTEFSSLNRQDALRITAAMKTLATYVFWQHRETGDMSTADLREYRDHDQAEVLQARHLADHVAVLQKVLFIDDIYAHPLIRRQDILSGHRIRAFAGTPIYCEQGGFQGVLCTVDTKRRRWEDDDIEQLRNTARQMLRRVTTPREPSKELERN
ncbi:GAF domain-containing protein [uncultured Roseobacter sp.]|uniref:GAF domain-containing protein n=2 Tax=uncultured Roseobacter sp. TaxID=114847 RepID=UPI0026310D68|nr:GAF domain-containing protein [uncultured Roseobacter sp.]